MTEERAPHAAQRFATAGEALFGRAWQSPLARVLDMPLRTVQRIAEAAGLERDYPIPATKMVDLASYVREREARLRMVWFDLKREEGR